MIKVFLLILALTFPFFHTYSQSIFIKLNVAECASCASVVNNVIKLVPTAKVVIKEEYLSDSLDVFERFNFFEFNKNILWSDSLYNLLSYHEYSEVLIIENNQVKFKKSFKDFSLPDFKSTYLGIQKARTFLFPSQFNLNARKNSFLAYNYVSRKYYVIDSLEQYYTVKYDDSLLKSIYLNDLKDSVSFHEYQKQYQGAWRPTIASAFLQNDSLLHSVIVTYRIKSVKGHDTTLSKNLTLLTIQNGTPCKTYVIDLTGLPVGYEIFEDEFVMHDGKLYIQAAFIVNGEVLNKKHRAQEDFKYLAEFKLQNGRFLFDRLYDYTLHKSTIEYGIFNNFFSYIYSNGYLTNKICNEVVDLTTMKKFDMPIPDSLFEMNRNSMSDSKLHYANVDLKYNDLTREFTLLYRIEDKYYVGRFSKAAKHFKRNEIILDKAALKNSNLRGICLSDDASSLVYSLKGEQRLLKMALFQ